MKIKWSFKKSLNQQALTNTNVPKGHSAMDKALTCHTGGRGLNPGQDQDQYF